MAYYIGTEKEYDGAFPFTTIACITTACRISSEIMAKTKRRTRRISPSVPNLGKKLVISNFIPFTTLNLIFAFSFFTSTIIRVIQQTQIGVPKISIHSTVILICLFLSNSEAKTHFKHRLAALRGVDMEPAHPIPCKSVSPPALVVPTPCPSVKSHHHDDIVLLALEKC